MYLDRTYENMCVCNAPNSTFKGLFLDTQSLERRLNPEEPIG